MPRSFNNFLIYIYISCFIISFSNGKNYKLIISLLIENQSIVNVKSLIKSIINQQVDHSLYKIILMVSKKKKNLYLSEEFITFINENEIQLNIIEKKYNFQIGLISTFNKWPDKPILLINDNTFFPEGWLEMYINDNKKYPNDIIAGSIQYFIDGNLNIKTFSEGYKGQYLGIFNHIANLIFNFAFTNIKLGGVLFPYNIFKNKLFYDLKLFSKISRNSLDFWISCFIIIENRILRQSSKIYDYTKYIINKSEFINENLTLYEDNLKKILIHFPWFKKIVHQRQKKVLISLTSYPQRFEYLPSVINSVKNQKLLINGIKLVLFKKDIKLYKDNIKGIEIISVNRDLKPHKKYYYTMSKFRDYAIITIDDDTIYCHNMLKSLYESYIEHPNIISGRGGHFMKYKNNGELSDYLSWFEKTNSINEIDYNIFLIGIGGIIYPPDILNINKEYLGIIKEFLIGDDFVLKHLAIKKGIEQRLISSNHPQGLYELNSSMGRPLFDINKFRNNIYIEKINVAIENEIIKDLCINYKNIKTGLTIYLFNINSIKAGKTKTTFYVDAYSFCPIDDIFNFTINFDRIKASCEFIQKYSMIEENSNIHKTKRILVAFCYINKRIKNLNEYYFPKANNLNYSNMIIQNKHKYIPTIFKDFYLNQNSEYKLELIFFKSYPNNFSFHFELDNLRFNCTFTEEVIYKNDNKPIINMANCVKTNYFDINKIMLISGLPNDKYEFIGNKKKEISNTFIISRNFLEKKNNKHFIIIKGRIDYDLNNDILDLRIKFHYPNKLLTCKLKSGSRFVQAYIVCEVSTSNIKFIFAENQLIYSKSFDYNLLLINNETLFQNYRNYNNNNDYNINFIDDINKNQINNIILILSFLFVLGKIYYTYEKPDSFILKLIS